MNKISKNSNKGKISILELKPRNIYVPIHSETPIASLQSRTKGRGVGKDASQGSRDSSWCDPLRRLCWRGCSQRSGCFRNDSVVGPRCHLVVRCEISPLTSGILGGNVIKPEKIQGKEAGNIRSSPDQSVFEVVLKFNPLFGILFCFVFFPFIKYKLNSFFVQEVCWMLGTEWWRNMAGFLSQDSSSRRVGVGRDCIFYLQAHFIKNKKAKKPGESCRESVICVESHTGYKENQT